MIANIHYYKRAFDGALCIEQLMPDPTFIPRTKWEHKAHQFRWVTTHVFKDKKKGRAIFDALKQAQRSKKAA